jgi:hypothetical protein
MDRLESAVRPAKGKARPALLALFWYKNGVSNGDRTRDNWNHNTSGAFGGARGASKQGESEGARDGSRPLGHASDRSRTDCACVAALDVHRLGPDEVRAVGRLAGELAALVGAGDSAGALEVYRRIGALLFGEVGDADVIDLAAERVRRNAG